MLLVKRDKKHTSILCIQALTVFPTQNRDRPIGF